MSALDALCVLFEGAEEAVDEGPGDGSSGFALARVLQRLQRVVDALRRGSDYAVALADGVEALMAWCWDGIAVVEAEVTVDEGLTAAHVHARLAPLLHAAAATCDAVEAIAADAGNCTAAACDVLSPLLHSGVPAARGWGALLLARVRKVLCHQLQAWVAWGELPVDAHSSTSRLLGGGRSTFFVRRTRHTPASAPVTLLPSSGGAAVPVHRPAGAGAAGDDGRRDEGAWVAGVSPGEPATPLAATVAALQRSVWEDEWRRGFAVDEAALPRSLVPPPLAETVCMLGKVVLLLQQCAAAAGRGKGGGVSSEEDKEEWTLASVTAEAAMGRSGVLDDPAAGDSAAMDDSAPPWTELHSMHAAAAIGACFPQVALPQLPLSLRDAAPGGAEGLVVDVNVVALRSTIDRVRRAVLRRLWVALQRSVGSLRTHAVGVRQYLLLGRGDLFRAFWELSGGVMAATPATSPAALTTITAGPWVAAAAMTNVFSEDAALSSLAASLRAAGEGSAGGRLAGEAAGGSGGGEDDGASIGADEDSAAGAGTAAAGAELGVFDRCHWALHHSALRWLAPAPQLTVLDGGGADEASTAVGHAHAVPARFLAPPASQLLPDGGWLKQWYPPAGAHLDAVASAPRGEVALTAVGHAGFTLQTLMSSAVDLGAAAGEAGGEALQCIASFLHIASPHAALAVRTPPVPRFGALWSPHALVVTQGFLARFTVLVHMNAFPGGTAAGGPAGAGETASFAFVLQRHGASSLGHTAGLPEAIARDPAHGLLLSGFTGIGPSVVVQLLVKRLPAMDALTGGRAVTAPRTFRVVAAVYGPEGTDAAHPTTRKLLASSMLPDVVLPPLCAYVDDALDRTAVAYPLTASVEFALPPLAEAASGGGGWSAGPLDGTEGPPAPRLRVHLALPPPPTAPPSTPLTSRSLLDCELPLDHVLDCVGWAPAGRSRAWLGFTAQVHDATPHASRCSISLSGCDVVSHDRGDAGWGGLVLDYSLPWPLHVLLDSAAVAVLQDAFRLLYRTKAASHALHDAWVTLVQSGASSGREGAPGAPAMQRQGVGGKRSEAASRRVRAQGAVQRLLQPVWLLRSHMAFLVDALMTHLQVDVVEGAWGAWMEGLASATEFSAVVAKCEAFVAAVRVGMFLAQPSLASAVDRLLAHCADLAAVVRRHRDSPTQLLDPSGGRGEVLRLRDAFAADSRMLTGLLVASGRLHDTRPLLARLGVHGVVAEEAGAREGGWGEE